MKVTGSMSLQQVRAILSSWTNEAPPPVRTQIMVLRSLEKLKVKAQERASQAGRDRLTKALARAARALRPPKRSSPWSKIAASGLLTGSMLAKELEISQDQVYRLKARGVLQGRIIGRRMLFSLDESRAAIAMHAAAVEGAKACTRRRAAELTCSNCKSSCRVTTAPNTRPVFVPVARRGSNSAASRGRCVARSGRLWPSHRMNVGSGP